MGTTTVDWPATLYPSEGDRSAHWITESIPVGSRISVDEMDLGPWASVPGFALDGEDVQGLGAISIPPGSVGDQASHGSEMASPPLAAPSLEAPVESLEAPGDTEIGHATGRGPADLMACPLGWKPFAWLHFVMVVHGGDLKKAK